MPLKSLSKRYEQATEAEPRFLQQPTSKNDSCLGPLLLQGMELGSCVCSHWDCASIQHTGVGKHRGIKTQSQALCLQGNCICVCVGGSTCAKIEAEVQADSSLKAHGLLMLVLLLEFVTRTKVPLYQQLSLPADNGQGDA